MRINHRNTVTNPDVLKYLVEKHRRLTIARTTDDVLMALSFRLSKTNLDSRNYLHL